MKQTFNTITGARKLVPNHSPFKNNERVLKLSQTNYIYYMF